LSTEPPDLGVPPLGPGSGVGRSGHTSVRSLARYARVSPDAVARHVAESDPAPQVVRQMTRPGIP